MQIIAAGHGVHIHYLAGKGQPLHQLASHGAGVYLLYAYAPGGNDRLFNGPQRLRGQREGLDQRPQLLPLLTGQLVHPPLGRNAAFGHHHRDKGMGQQCLQRVAKGPVGAPLKVPQHPGIQLLRGQPRLAVDGDAVIGGNIHIAAGGQGQRPADAKMGEQHLAQLAVYHLAGFLLDEVQRYIAQRKPHQRGKLLVRILADDGHQ